MVLLWIIFNYKNIHALGKNKYKVVYNNKKEDKNIKCAFCEWF